MKKILAAAGLIFIAGCAGAVSSQEAKKAEIIRKPAYVKPVITYEQAKKKIEEYVKGTKEASDKINICEGNRYYIGEVYIKGYEGIDVIRKIYVDKVTGDLLPSFADTYDYCYMVKR